MIRVAIIGFNFMGTMHAQVYQAIPGVKVVAVVGRDADRTREVVRRFGLDVPVFLSVQELLATTEVDVVDICVPTDLHRKFFLEAVAAGKHVFCEKPLALELGEAEEMCRAASAAGVFVQIGYCIRFWPEYQALAQLVSSQNEGPLQSLQLWRRSPRPPGGEGNWLNNEQRSGGAALDLHIHDTDFALSLLGMPKAVTSVGFRDEDGWSHLHTVYHHDGLVVTGDGAWNSPGTWGFRMAFEAVFEHAVVEYDSRREQSITITREDSMPVPLPIDRPPIGDSVAGLGNISDLGGYYNQLKSFVSALRQNEQPRIGTLKDARDSLRIVLAEIESAATGRTISLL